VDGKDRRNAAFMRATGAKQPTGEDAPVADLSPRKEKRVRIFVEGERGFTRKDRGTDRDSTKWCRSKSRVFRRQAASGKKRRQGKVHGGNLALGALNKKGKHEEIQNALGAFRLSRNKSSSPSYSLEYLLEIWTTRQFSGKCEYRSLVRERKEREGSTPGGRNERRKVDEFRLIYGSLYVSSRELSRRVAMGNLQNRTSKCSVIRGV